MSDPYSDAAGFGGAATATRGASSSDPYSAAAGFTPRQAAAPARQSSPAQPGDTPDGIAEQIRLVQSNGGQPITPADQPAIDRTVAALQAKLAKMGGQPAPAGPVNGGLGAVNPHRNIPQSSGVATVAAHVPGTNDIVPGAVPTSGAAPETLADKLRGAGQAAGQFANSAIGSAVGAPIGFVQGVGGAISDAANGKPYNPNGIENATTAMMQRFSGQNPQTTAPMNDAGQRYSAAINGVVQNVGAVAPMNEFQLGASQMPGARQYLQDQFAAMKGNPMPVAARVEPTLAKPRYGVVDGKITRIDTPPEAATAAVPAKAPTLADASPNLQAAITKARASGATNPAVEQAHITADTLPVPIQLTKGQATGDPSLISAEMNTRGKAQPLVSPEFYRKQGEAVAANMDAIRTQAAPDVPTSASMIDHGQSLLDSYKQMDAPIRADISAKYKALSDANGGTLPLNGQDFVNAADAALQKSNKGYFVPAEVKSLMADYRDGGPMTYDAFENLRTILGAEERKYAGKDGNAAHAISLVRDSLESLPMTGEAANIKPLADAARQAAASRFAAIKSDPAYKAAVTDSAPAGEPSALADKFFGNYVLKSPRANLALMREHLNGDPAAMQTISAGTVDHLAAQLKADPKGGTFSQSQYNNALTALKPKLDSLLDPQTAQHVQALGETAKRLQQQPRGSYVNNSNTLVGAMSEAAKGGLEGAVNVAAHGVPVGTWTRNLVARRANAKAADNAVAPGAGVTVLKDIGK